MEHVSFSNPQNIHETPELIVSLNNHDRDIAQFFKQREKIKEDLVLIVESSLLDVKDKDFFLEKISSFVFWVEKRASSLGVCDEDAIEIYKVFAQSIFTNNKNQEVQAVYDALRTVLFEKYQSMAQ